MHFRMIHDERSGGASYLLADLDSAEAVLIDPQAADRAVLLALLAEYRLQLLWLLRTHQHEEWLPAAEFKRLQEFGAPIVQGREKAGQRLLFGGESIDVIATPGHTADCLSFRWRDRLFCGDLLAMDTCPYQSAPLDPEALWDSVTGWLFRLPDETLLFSAHAHQRQWLSLLVQQRCWHPWFARTGRDEFLPRLNRRLSPSRVPSPDKHKH